jgi:hypothetical protein
MREAERRSRGPAIPGAAADAPESRLGIAQAEVAEPLAFVGLHRRVHEALHCPPWSAGASAASAARCALAVPGIALAVGAGAVVEAGRRGGGSSTFSA